MIDKIEFFIALFNCLNNFNIKYGMKTDQNNLMRRDLYVNENRRLTARYSNYQRFVWLYKENPNSMHIHFSKKHGYKISLTYD